MSDGKYLFPAYDGQLAILQAFIKYFSHLPDRFEFRVLMPDKNICSEQALDEFITIISKTAFKTKNVRISYQIENFIHISPIINRYNFNPRLFEDYFKCNFDLIINNIPEISRNIIACYPKDYKAKLISCHWFPDYFFQNELTGSWDNGIKFSYSFRQLDGILSSDLNIFICESTLKGWQESIEKTFNFDAVTEIENHSKLISLCVTDLDEYENISKTFKQEKFTEFTAIFPSRITNSMYTNWKVAFDMFMLDPRGRIIFCNPSGEKGLQCIDKFYPTEKFEEVVIQLNSGSCFRCRSYNCGKLLIVLSPLDKQMYYELCVMCHSIINFYMAERYGGVAIREAIALGKLVPFVPCIYEFEEWFAGRNVFKKLYDYMVFNEVDDLSSIPNLITKYNNFLLLCVGKIHIRILETFKEIEHYTKDIRKFKAEIIKLLGENK
jgi:hypothetical protein